MNVLYVSQYFSFTPTHASAVTTYEIVKRLVEKGHEVTIIVPNIDCGDNVRFATHNFSNNIKIIAFTSTRIMREDSALFGLTCTAWYAPLLVKMLKRAKYDVIMSMYHPSHLATFSAYILSRFLKLPLIIKIHDLVPDMTDPNIVRRVYKKAMFRLYLTLLKKGDFILVLSSELKNLATKIYGVDEKKLVLFPNAVDVHKFNPSIKSGRIREKLGLENKKILLFAGAISRDRRLDYLIKAMSSVVREEANATLLILGEGPEKTRLLDLSKQFGVDKFVKFLNKVPHDSVPEYVSLADITIGPLTMLPGTLGAVPLKVLEYMACGKPVVACYGCVSEELVIDGYNGLLVRDGDTTELATAISRLIKDKEFANDLGSNARRHVEKFYDWNALITKLDRVIREQINRSHFKLR